MKHLGDICKINGAEVEPVSVIIGGSPCQDLSVAGKRAGLDGERSGLFMEQIRIIKEMRESDRRNGRTGELCRPRYMVWENVPGAFSSNSGEDFRTVLEETAKVADQTAVIPRPPKGRWTNAGTVMGNGWSVAWRVLDAQFWGVPQRRRRIALVADFGGQSAPEILFKPKSVSGHFEPCGETWQGTAGDVENGIGDAVEPVILESNQNHAQVITNGISNSIPAAMGMGGGYTPMIAYGISDYESNSMKSDNPHSGVYEADTSRTLDNNGGNPACNQGGMAIVQSAGFKGGQSSGGIGYADEQAPTLQATPSALEPTVAVFDASRRHAVYSIETKQQSLASEDGKAGTIGANDYKEPQAICYVTDQGAGKSSVSISEGVSPTLATTHDGAPAVCYDARGNGNGDISPTITGDHQNRILDNNGGNPACNQGGDHQNRVTDYTALCIGNGQMCNMSMKPIANSLDTMHDQQAVMTWDLDRAAYNQGKNAKYNFSIEQEKIGAQVAKGPGAVATKSIVRRLTPLECERLQGYPDGWTDIGDWTDTKGKTHKAADSPRYKALGNSIAVPCWRFILQGISERVQERTMASLFDGIGGFPLIWEEINGSKSCRWVSEIEEFPIAVTKMRFEQE